MKEETTKYERREKGNIFVSRQLRGGCAAHVGPPLAAGREFGDEQARALHELHHVTDHYIFFTTNEVREDIRAALTRGTGVRQQLWPNDPFGVGIGIGVEFPGGPIIGLDIPVCLR